MAQKKDKDLPTAARFEPRGLEFSLFTTGEIKKLSVVEIQTPLIFDTIGQALPFGLHDASLGPMDKLKDICSTCRVGMQLCSGHMGHIQLPLPVINPLFHSTIYHLLKHMCSSCYKYQLSASAKHLLATQLKLLKAGYLVEALEAESYLPSAEGANPGDALNEFYIRKKLSKYMSKVLASDPCQPICDESTGKIVQSLINRLLSSFTNVSVKESKCMHCKEVVAKFVHNNNRLYIVKKATGGKTKKVLMPSDTQNFLRELWKNESDFVSMIVPLLLDSGLEHPTDILFLDVIAVIPPKVRPVNVLQGSVSVHPQTNNYKPIIQDCISLKHLIGVMQKKEGDESKQTEEAMAMIATTPGATTADKLFNMWNNLQADVDHLMDAAFNKNSNSELCHGLKQVIEKKAGCIRMHMMGKRVNFAARSVITPDPNLDMEEIGVPEAFALVLTYPTPVTSWNAAELRKMILNGPKVHPGAVSVEYESGLRVRLSETSLAQREGVAKRLLTPSGESKTFLRGIKVVNRHLHNGDVMLLNRQPTLHRPGIMAHKARILKGEKTLRLNYANCKAYNADFDGDEMNAHFPQNELARAEAYTLVNVCNNYLVPKDGTPLSGLIQDHVVSGVRMTLRGRFFNKDDYSQLVYQALGTVTGKITLLQPTILKPCRLWSGKQIISTVILNVIPRGMAPINLLATAKIGCRAWQKEQARAWKAGGTALTDDMDMSESQVVIRKGELLCGVLDKTHYGATPFGLVHCLYELYGGQCSSRLLSAFSKLFTAFLQTEGFTLGVEDILVLDDAEEARNESIRESREIGNKTAAQAFDLTNPTANQLREKLELSLSTNKVKWRTVIDRAYKTSLDRFTNVVNKVCLPAGLLRQFPDNNLQLMVQSGAKGSTVNTMQISCLLGQIELEGKRPPLMISGKSLPSFPKYDTSPRSGGFIDGRFLTGIQPQEFFFHCMAGREGLIDTAVKTSRSGYLQRCLIKHLEGLTVNYDQTVRDSDGSVVQFYYGEDGLDVMKAQFLTPTQMPFLLDNAQAVIVKTDLLDRSLDAGILSRRSQIEDWVESRKDVPNPSKVRRSPFTKFTQMKGESLPPEVHRDFVARTGRMKASAVLSELWRRAKDKESSKSRYFKNSGRCPDPVMSLYQADRDFGTLTERMEKLMSDHVTSLSRRKLARKSKAVNDFRTIMSHKSMKSLCPAGEPVGLLAAQSIGEPSTQMTLNTFHFAGRGEMNVTLGIPRLREILMVASKTMKTPSMDIPFLPNQTSLQQKAERLKKDVALVTLSDVLESVTINFHLEHDEKRVQVYKICMDFLPEKIYKAFCSITPDDILEFIENKFVKLLMSRLNAKSKKDSTLRVVAEETQTKTVDSDDEEHEPRDKRARKANASSATGEEHVSSDEDEEGEDEDATMARSRARHSEREYEDPEAVEEDGNNVESDDDGLDETSIKDPEELSENESFYEDRPKIKSESEVSKAQRVQDVLNSNANVRKYEYGSAKGQSWCCLEVGISLNLNKVDLSSRIREIADKCILREVLNIRKGFTYTNNDTQSLVFKTDGINIPEMFKYYKLLDLNKLYTNDIHGMAATYGIEAARRVIVREVQDVFKMYGITVDPRHLLLIADYMTYNGVFEPLNRTGMEKNVSPLQQMSFESSLKFLKLAAISGKKEDLFSPSSRLMIGRPCKSGTGMFQVYQTFKKAIKSEVDLPMSPKRMDVDY